MQRGILLAIAAMVLVGCDDRRPAASATAPTPSASSVGSPDPARHVDPEINDFLFQLIRDHQIPAHREGDWIAFDNAAGVRVNADLFSADDKPQGTIVQLTFRLALRDGHEVRQSVVGMGKDRKSAVGHSEVSFMLGTFHAWLGAFVDADEEHVERETRKLAGQERVITLGGPITKTMGGGSTQPVEDGKWKEKFFQALDRMDVGPGTHWVDLYHATVQKEELMEIQLDNTRWNEMEQALAGTSWPTNGVYTSVRLFVVIQDVDDPTRPAKHASTRPATHPSTRPKGLGSVSRIHGLTTTRFSPAIKERRRVLSESIGRGGVTPRAGEKRVAATRWAGKGPPAWLTGLSVSSIHAP